MIITLKDGSTKEYGAPMTVLEIAKDISEGLARAAAAGEMNGEVVDLRHEMVSSSGSDCLGLFLIRKVWRLTVIQPPTFWHRRSSVCTRRRSWPSALPSRMGFITTLISKAALLRTTWKSWRRR